MLASAAANYRSHVPQTKQATPPHSGAVAEVLNLDEGQLLFDPENPRLPPSVDGADDTAVLAWMLGDSSLLDLIRSIAQDGYFGGEPILVAKTWDSHPTFDGTYLVVEGNRRLAAIRLLSKPELAPRRTASVRELSAEARVRTQLVPSLVYETRQEILERLGYRHITGIKEWDSIAKARFLRQLLGKPPATRPARATKLRFLASRVGAGNRTDYVRRLLNGLALFDFADERTFWNLEGVNDETVKFSLLTTAISYERIARWIELDPDKHLVPNGFKEVNVRRLFEWMYSPTGPGRKPVVPESRALGQLAEVVGNPRAERLLIETGSLAQAALLTDVPIKAFRESLSNGLAMLQVAVREISAASVATTIEDRDLAQESLNVARSILRLVEAGLVDAVDA